MNEIPNRSDVVFLTFGAPSLFFLCVGAALLNSNLEAVLRKLKAVSTAVDTDTASDKIHFATNGNHAKAEDGSCSSVTPVARLRSEATPCGICSG